MTSNSEDHRGTPQFPGRVVTLIERSFWESLGDPVRLEQAHQSAWLIHPCQQRETESERVWGAAYHIIPSKVQEVKEYLDIREINGYSVQYTTFHAAGPHARDIPCLVYIGMPDNPQFMGALETRDVAERINQSVGPSGENRDYLLHLEESLKGLSAESGDAHVSDLARRIRSMVPRQAGRSPETRKGSGLDKAVSNEEQEEIEKESG
jgi:glutathione-specific gamma-glutamylcyclotransferase